MSNTIRDYLWNNTDLPESTLDDVAQDIEERLDYSPIYEQIDKLIKQSAYAADYERTIRN
jgi:hypothetical protein